MRWGAAAALVAAGTLAWLVPRALGRLAGDLGFSGAVEHLAEAVAAVSRWLAGSLAIWQRTAGVLEELLATPEAVVGALASTLVASLALRLLSLLIARERKLCHASL